MLELALRVGLSLAIVLGLFWVVARTSSRRMSGNRSLLKVRGRQSLSRTSSIAIVEVGNRVLVVGVSDGGVRLLTELDPGDVDDTVNGQVVRADEDEVESIRPVLTVAGKRRATPAAATPALGGSILAPDTWKSAWAAATSKPLAGHAARSSLGEPLHD